MDVEILPILCVGQTHRFVPTGGHTMACPYDIVLCVFGGRCMQRSYNKLGAGKSCPYMDSVLRTWHAMSLQLSFMFSGRVVPRPYGGAL